MPRFFFSGKLNCESNDRNGSVKVQPGNNAIKFWSDSTIDTAGTIQGKIVNEDEEDYYGLRIYNELYFAFSSVKLLLQLNFLKKVLKSC